MPQKVLKEDGVATTRSVYPIGPLFGSPPCDWMPFPNVSIDRLRTLIKKRSCPKKTDRISILQSMNIRIDSKDNKERTPLNLAIEEKNNRKTIRILLHIGADPNIHNKRGENPVLLAAILGRFKIASWIIKHAKIPFSSYNCRDLKGRTILHAAVEKNMSLDIFQTFLGGDFDLNIVNPQWIRVED